MDGRSKIARVMMFRHKKAAKFKEQLLSEVCLSACVIYASFITLVGQTCKVVKSAGLRCLAKISNK